MAPATRVQIFEVVAAHFASMTKKPFEIIGLKRLCVDLHRGVSAAFVAKLHPLLGPNVRHRIKQFRHAQRGWVSVQDRFDDVGRQHRMHRRYCRAKWLSRPRWSARGAWPRAIGTHPVPGRSGAGGRSNDPSGI